MMRVGNADLRVTAAALLPTEHERRDAGQVALPRQGPQIEHELRVLLVGGRNTGGLRHDRQVAAALFLRALDATLDIPYGVEILADLETVTRAERRLQLREPIGDHVENAALHLDPRQPRLMLGALTRTE